MRFLTRLLKTPEEDQDEEQDEFDAEENGLLMTHSLSGDREGAALAGTPEADAPQAKVPAAEGEMANPPSQGEARPAEDEAGQLLAGEGKPADPTEGSPPPQSQAPESVGEEAQTEEGSSDDPMHMFRASAKRAHMAQALKADLEDVPVADLLAEARSIRNDLLGREAAGGEKPQEQQRAA
jgi:hypothetical protein